ncbi:MAG: hypothetical protein HFJ12_01245 [Bacilli bacterium]|nr:hypothetical protein [Bacilli bacterium]
MFTLEEILSIGNKYSLELDKDNNKFYVNIKNPKDSKELTKAEISYIKSCLFLRHNLLHIMLIFGSELSDEEFLKKLQTDFIEMLFSSSKLKLNTTSPAITPTQMLWNNVFLESIYGGMDYLFNILKKNGKMVQMLSHSFADTKDMNRSEVIQYELTDYKEDISFQYITDVSLLSRQMENMITITIEQKKRRREYVNKMMELYRKCESKEDYKQRIEKEQSDMKWIFNTVDKDGHFLVIADTAFVRVMDLLFAAKKLSIPGQRDYLEEFIDKPEINNFLLRMQRYYALDEMYKAIQKKNGQDLHKPTHWEVTRKTSEEFLNESPNAYKMAEDLLSTGKTFKIKKGNNGVLKKAGARLLELIVETQGFDVTCLAESFLQVDHDDDKSTKNRRK